MHQVAIAHRTIDTALVIRDIIDLHDVPIRGNGQATFTAQYVVCHSGNQPRKLFTRKHIHFGRSPGFDFTVGTREIISNGDTRYPHYFQGFTINSIANLCERELQRWFNPVGFCNLIVKQLHSPIRGTITDCYMEIKEFRFYKL